MIPKPLWWKSIAKPTLLPRMQTSWASPTRLPANALATNSTDVEALMETELQRHQPRTGRQALVSKIGENVQVRRISRMTSDGNDWRLCPRRTYWRTGRNLEGGDSEIARDIAMHIAALNPAYIDVDDVPADVLEKEKQFLISQAADSGKPAEIIEKMVTGRMRKHLSSITLLGQDFVKDGDLTVAKLLEQNGASVKGFIRLEVGEGIEKKEENFADEVMQQVKGG